MKALRRFSHALVQRSEFDRCSLLKAKIRTQSEAVQVNAANRGSATRALLPRAMMSLLLLVFGLASLDALATRKTDTVTLYNGDHVTGEIESLAGGLVIFDTAAMGKISIEWEQIASISSNYRYEVRLSDGERLFGSVKPGESPGSVLVKGQYSARNLHWEEIAELRPVEKTKLDRLDVYVSANYSYTKASDVTQTELRASVSYEDERSLNAMENRLTLSDTENESRSSSRVALSRQVWTDRRAVYRTLFGGYETNDELGIDYRFTGGAGLGRYFIDDNHQTLTGVFGLQVLEEERAGDESSESIEGVLGGKLSRWNFHNPELDLTIDATLYPSLTESGRVRADSSATLRWEIISDLFLDLSAWGSYDSAADDEQASEFDYGVTTGLGWEF